MIFCGQCGLQLSPGSTRCPRCGAAVEGTGGTGAEVLVEDQTMASPSFMPRHPSGTGHPGTPPPLVLRPGAPDYNTQGANDATSMMEAPNFNTRMPPSQQNMGGTFAGGGYQDYGTQNQGGYMQTNAGYPGLGSSMNYGGSQVNAQQQSGNKNLRASGLVITVLGVLLILIAVVLFALQRSGVII